MFTITIVKLSTKIKNIIFCEIKKENIFFVIEEVVLRLVENIILLLL